MRLFSEIIRHFCDVDIYSRLCDCLPTFYGTFLEFGCLWAIQYFRITYIMCQNFGLKTFSTIHQNFCMNFMF